MGWQEGLDARHVEMGGPPKTKPLILMVCLLVQHRRQHAVSAVPLKDVPISWVTILRGSLGRAVGLMPWHLIKCEDCTALLLLVRFFAWMLQES